MILMYVYVTEVDAFLHFCITRYGKLDGFNHERDGLILSFPPSPRSAAKKQSVRGSSSNAARCYYAELEMCRSQIRF